MKQVTNIMNFMLLSCKDATKYASIKNYTNLPWHKKLQLRMHLAICHPCREFAKHSDFIDHKVEEAINCSDVSFSEEKKKQMHNKIIRDC